MIDQIQEAITKRDTARKTIATLNEQIRQVKAEVSAAEAKIAELRADDAGNLADLAKSMAEQSAIAELGNQRSEKLRGQLPPLQQSAASAESHIRQLVTMAFDKLTSFRRHRAMHEISKEICARISPATRTGGNTRLWLQRTIYDLSAHDASLDPVSMLVSSGIPGSREERRVNIGPLEPAVQYVTENAAELAEAIEWDQARRDAINANPRPAGVSYDPVNDVPLYGSKSVF